jgi:hypothetical protein
MSLTLLGALPLWVELTVAGVTVASLAVAVVAIYLAYKFAKEQLGAANQGLTAARESLDATHDIARAQFILAIDDALARYENVRIDVTYDPSTLPSKGRRSAELRYYIAVFERIGLLADQGLLDSAEIDELYGSRFAALLNNTDAAAIVQRTESWWGFIYLWHQLRDRGRPLPEPPEQPARVHHQMTGPEADEANGA